MRCKQCPGSYPERCPVCNFDLTNKENVICGIGIIPENHCFNCWRKK